MPDPTDDRQLPLHHRHVQAGAVFGSEGGWQVPLRYAGVLDELQAAAGRAAVCDLSHIGRVRIKGDGALALLDRAATVSAARQEDHTARLNLLCDDHGGILDCGYLHRLEKDWLLTTDPAQRRTVLAHLQGLADEMGLSVTLEDRTDKTVMLGVVGPAGPDLLDTVLPQPVGALTAGELIEGSYLVARYVAARTGATALWSLEVVVGKLLAGQAWDYVTARLGDGGLAPMGAAARDVLRISAALPRYGHEINRTIDPVTAGLMHAVDLDHDFLGRPAVEEIARRGPARRRVALAASEAGPGAIPRCGDALHDEAGLEVGAVTSATYSPIQQRVVAMGYLAPASAELGTTLTAATAEGDRAMDVAAGRS